MQKRVMQIIDQKYSKVKMICKSAYFSTLWGVNREKNVKNGPIFGVGRFCELRFRYLSSPTGTEGGRER